MLHVILCRGACLRTKHTPNVYYILIALIGNRPAIQIGNYRVDNYDTSWLGAALRRAATAADREDFPMLDEIRQGIEEYLESHCTQKQLSLVSLYDRVRKMLERIGCQIIAEKLEPLAPPITLSLKAAAHNAGNGFELAFFEFLRNELSTLRSAGAEEIHFVDLRESVQLLRNAEKWNKSCDHLMAEIRDFLEALNNDKAAKHRKLRFDLDADIKR